MDTVRCNGRSHSFITRAAHVRHRLDSSPGREAAEQEEANNVGTTMINSEGERGIERDKGSEDSASSVTLFRV